MNKSYRKSLFIFRRDLRLQDNTALINALRSSEIVIPCFIFDPRQIGNQPYRGERSIGFMLESLRDLEKQLNSQGGKLYIFEGLAHETLEKIIQAEKIDAVYLNADYTPFSRKRDKNLNEACLARGVHFQSFHDCLLNQPDAVRTNDGGIYTVFSPYLRKAMTHQVPEPVDNQFSNFYRSKIGLEKRERLDFGKGLEKQNPAYDGGRDEVLKILASIGSFRDYNEKRDYPAFDATTKLSAHNKFGTCSIREAYHAARKKFGIDHALIRELYWRDFFTYIGYHFPHVLGKAFHEKYAGIPWENNSKLFGLWCEGKTGFPIVDAGMRELNASGFMQNRLRMITASFLVKDLHIDWRWGEKYFAQKLIDYDPLVNNGNWQWVASTGCDAQPYFRIFNPWLQQQKFDPQALYIKKWVPELKNISSAEIHQIEKKGLTFKDYPQPVIWHEEEKAKALIAYQGKIV